MNDRHHNIVLRWARRVCSYVGAHTKESASPPPVSASPVGRPEITMPQVKPMGPLDRLLDCLELADLKDFDDTALFRLLQRGSGEGILNEQVSCLLSALHLAIALERCKVEPTDLAENMAFLASQLLYLIEIPEDGPTRCKMSDTAAQNLCRYVRTKVQGFTLEAVAHGEFIDMASMDPLHEMRDGERYGISLDPGDMRKKVIPRSCCVCDPDQNVRIKALVEYVT